MKVDNEIIEDLIMTIGLKGLRFERTADEGVSFIVGDPMIMETRVNSLDGEDVIIALEGLRDQLARDRLRALNNGGKL